MNSHNQVPKTPNGTQWTTYSARTEKRHWKTVEEWEILVGGRLMTREKKPLEAEEKAADMHGKGRESKNRDG